MIKADFWNRQIFFGRLRDSRSRVLWQLENSA
jgi:hypothetical protein